jgi:hypothetical protein
VIDKSEWTTADFEELSWHDCHVYGFSLAEREHGTAELVFDIDFIVEWLCRDDGTCEFRVAPATLTFHSAHGLRFELDYGTPTAGMTPFSLAGIERDEVRYPTGDVTFNWRMPINWPNGLITFESPGFTQVLRRAPIVSGTQALGADQHRIGQ